MRIINYCIAIAMLGPLYGISQQNPAQLLNLGFEKTDDKNTILGCQFPFGSSDYYSYRDDQVKYDGKNAIRIEKNRNSQTKGSGNVTFNLPAYFRWETITLRGYIKTDSVEVGKAGLWLRTANGSQMHEMKNVTIDSGLSNDWKQYHVTIKKAEPVTDLSFGGMLTGSGKAWFDKFELLVDNRPVQSVAWLGVLPRIELTASNVVIDNTITSSKQQNLYVLAKVWGFLKYHHPYVAKGEYDFDSSLFVVMPKVMNAKDKTERDQVLMNWINSLGDENSFPAYSKPPNEGIHSTVNLHWINDQKLFTSALTARLNNIYRHRNTGPNYYVRLVPNVGNPNFATESLYKQVPASDDGMRLLGLFRYWNCIEYFFPYKHLLKEDWSKSLKEFIPKFCASRTPIDYRLTSLRLINRVYDTHANIYNDSLLLHHYGAKFPVIITKYIDGKVIVYDWVDDSLAAIEKLQKGDEIIAVNGISVSEHRKKVEQILCASNKTIEDRNFLERYLFRSNDDSVLITYRRNGNTGKTFLHYYYYLKMTYRNGDSWRMPMYKLLSPEIGYINLEKIITDSLPAIFAHFKNARGLIIDIRNYPNNFMPFSLGNYIKPSFTPFVKFTTTDLSNPGQFIFTPMLSNGVKEKGPENAFTGKIVILINEQSQSQSEYTAMALRTAPGAVVMGSQTAGADGNVSSVRFPGGFGTSFSGIGVFYPDGGETQGIGIVPDIKVLPTQKGIAEGRDEVLEKAIEYITRQNMALVK